MRHLLAAAVTLLALGAADPTAAATTSTSGSRVEGDSLRAAPSLALAAATEPAARLLPDCEGNNGIGREVADSTTNPTSVTYAYDPARGLPASVTWDQNSEVIAHVARNTSGAASERLGGLGDCLSRTWTRDHLGRTVATEVYNGCGGSPTVPVFDELYSYYDSGDVETLDAGRMGLATRSFLYTYDDRHQLATASASDYNAEFSYGDAGRLATAGMDVPSGALTGRDRAVRYDYDVTGGFSDPEAIDQLFNLQTGLPLISYDYDESGNVVVRDDADQGAFQFVYDGEDQQREAQNPDGSTEVYYYDHEGQRRVAVERSPTGVVTKVRFWHGDTELWFNGQGNEEKAWARVGLDGRTVARIENRTDLEPQFHNALGNLMGSLAPDYQSVEVAYLYGPFGDILDQLGSTADHLRRFNGKDYDLTSGLSYYGYRYYDPVSLTWTQADPLYRFVPDLAYDQPRRMSLYMFSGNNPLRYLDPNGQDWDDIKEGFGRAVEFVVVGAICALGCSDAGGGEFDSEGNHVSVGDDSVSYSDSAQQAAMAAAGAKFGAGLLKKAPKLIKRLLGKNADEAAEAGAEAAGTEAGSAAPAANRTGRGKNNLKPNSKADGAHSTFKRNTDGKVSGHAEYQPNSRSPSGFEQTKRVDTQHANSHTHKNKKTGEEVPTPHVHDKTTEGGVRPARNDELPE